jgi:hypothetical protein
VFVVRSTRENLTKRWTELHFERGLSSASGEAGVSASVDATNRKRAHGVEMWRAKWRRHGQRALERKVRRGDKARGQWTAFDDNVSSRFLNQKRAEQRGTWKVANEQSGAVEEKEKNLASHNRNVPVWKVATQERSRKGQRASASSAGKHGWRRARQAQSQTRQWVASRAYSAYAKNFKTEKW